MTRISHSSPVDCVRRGIDHVTRFVTDEGGWESTESRYGLEPLEKGTRVTESYAVRWIPTSARVVDISTNRARELRESMRYTLERIKNAAETTPTI